MKLNSQYRSSHIILECRVNLGRRNKGKLQRDGEHTFEIRRDTTGSNFLLGKREPKTARAIILFLEGQSLRFFGGFGTWSLPIKRLSSPVRG